MHRVVAICCFFIFTLNAHAYRCSQKIIDEGSSLYQTLDLCGEPKNQNSYIKNECSWNEFLNRRYCTDIQVDILTYKRSGMTTRLIFYNQVLQEIKTCRVC